MVLKGWVGTLLKFKSTLSTVLQILGGTASCSLFCFVLVCYSHFGIIGP